uniref:Dehydrogenase/reductase 13 n=1 Tax=Ursus maritimus TaxID=29073 RepID=A0A452U545_URSMA
MVSSSKSLSWQVSWPAVSFYLCLPNCPHPPCHHNPFFHGVVELLCLFLPPVRTIPEKLPPRSQITGAPGWHSGYGIEPCIRGERCLVTSPALAAPQESGNNEIIFMALDLASLASVRAFATAFLSSEPRLDILIHNAGISSCGRTHKPFNLLLRTCAPSRVVVVSSAAHRRGRLDFTRLDRPVVGWRQELRAYADSKLANVLFARELAAQLEGTGVTCYAAHPGPVNSELFLRHVPGWLRPLLRPLAWLVLRAPRGGAQTPLYCALQEGIEPLSGRYFANCHVEEVPPAARDDRAAHRLWEASKRLAGLGPGEGAEPDEDPQPEDTGAPSSLSSPHPEEPTVSEPHPSPQSSPDLSKVTRRIQVKTEPEP